MIWENRKKEFDLCSVPSIPRPNIVKSVTSPVLILHLSLELHLNDDKKEFTGIRIVTLAHQERPSPHPEALLQPVECYKIHVNKLKPKFKTKHNVLNSRVLNPRQFQSRLATSLPREFGARAEGH